LLTIVAVGIGSFAVLLIELSFYKVITGDLLFRFHAIERNYETASMWFFNQSSPYFGWEEGGYFRAVTRRLFLEGPNTILRMFSNLPALAMLSTAWALVFRNRRFLIPAAWFLSLCFMFNFMSSSFQAYRPLPVFDRYLYPLILPSALLFAGLLSTLVLTDFPSDLRRERRFWAWALILPFCGLFAIRTVDIFREGRPEQVARDVASRVGGGDTVYTDARTASSLVFFRTGKLLLSDSNTIPYEGVPARSMKDCAYVLVDRNVLDFLTKSYEYEQPAFVGAEDRSWHRVFSRDNAALFKIDHGHCH
jgi:hypothetical protein